MRWAGVVVVTAMGWSTGFFGEIKADWLRRTFRPMGGGKTAERTASFRAVSLRLDLLRLGVGFW